MPDDPSKRGAQDRVRIAMNQEHEVRYWTNTLGCSREQLQQAIEAVGNVADRVREFLSRGKNAHP